MRNSCTTKKGYVLVFGESRGGGGSKHAPPPSPLDSCWCPHPDRRPGVISPRSEYSSIYSERTETTPTLNYHVGLRDSPKTRARWWEFGILKWEATARGGVAPQMFICQGAPNGILCGSKRGVSVFWGVRESQERVYSRTGGHPENQNVAFFCGTTVAHAQQWYQKKKATFWFSG